MTSWKRQILFQVDISGVIEILDSAHYSRPDSAVRELIQNAHDAITRHRRTSLWYQGRSLIEQDPAGHSHRFSDDGVGLSALEAEKRFPSSAAAPGYCAIIQYTDVPI